MRDVLVMGIVLGSVPVAMMRPWIGILVWTWLSLMSPHKYCWGFAARFPVAAVVAAAILVGVIVSRDRQPLPAAWQNRVVIVLWFFFGLTTATAFFPEDARGRLLQVSKEFIMIFSTLLVINDRRKYLYLVVMMALSIGLVGFKGGLFTVLTAGRYLVYGPPGSFIADNNDAALAFCITLPFCYFMPRLLKVVKDPPPWAHYFGKVMPVITVFLSIAIIGTYSRGGFITLAAVIVGLTWRSRYRVVVAVTVAIALVVGAGFVTTQWKARMGTIQTAETKDASFRGRLGAWKTARNIAAERPFVGGGFHSFQGWVWDVYSPPEGVGHDVHSIYFQMLGEQGYPGLVLFLVLLFGSFFEAGHLRAKARRMGNEEIEVYATMIQISLGAYALGGAALGRAYWDYFYDLIGLLVLLKMFFNADLVVNQSRVGENESEAMAPGVVSWRPAPPLDGV